MGARSLSYVFGAFAFELFNQWRALSFSIASALCTLLLLSAGAGMAADKKWIVGYEPGNAPPYAFIHEDFLAGGIIVDFANIVGQESGVEVEFKGIPRVRVFDTLIEGGIHAVCTANPAWTSQKDQVNWSKPLFREINWFMGKQTGTWKNYSDLNGKRIGTITGYFYSKELSEMFASGKAKRVDSQTMFQSVDKLRKGELDAVVGSDILLNYMRYIYPKPSFEVAPLTDSSHEIYCALSKKSVLSVDEINKVIDKMKSKGSLDRLKDSYQKSRLEP